MVLAAILYIYQVTETTSVEPVTNDYVKDGQVHILQDKVIPPYVSIIRIHGPFLFGVTAKLEEVTADTNNFNKIVILRLRNMTAIDGTGLSMPSRRWRNVCQAKDVSSWFAVPEDNRQSC